MEVSELITILREDYLDDTFDGWESASNAERNDQFLWSDSFLLRSLTEAQRQACNRTDFLPDDETFTAILVAGTPTYALDKRVTVIEKVTLNDIDVVHKSKEEFQRLHRDWRTGTGIGGNECSYYMRGHTLRIYPIPDVGDAGKVLYFDTFRLPLDTITSTNDELEIPDEYHRDLLWWVLYECFNKRDAETYNPENAKQYLRSFNDVFGTYVPSEVRLNQLQENTVATIRPVDYLGSTNDNNNDWYN